MRDRHTYLFNWPRTGTPRAAGTEPDEWIRSLSGLPVAHFDVRSVIKESNETPEKLHGAGVELLILGSGFIGLAGLARKRLFS